MKTTEVMTMLEQELKAQWDLANQAKSQDEYRALKAKAIETFNKLRKQRNLTKGL